MTNNAPHTPARTVAITGGARGIGYQTAKELIRRGHRVAIGDIDEARAKEAAAELGVKVVTRLDVTEPDSFTTFLDLVERELGPLDILINNAGIMPTGHAHEEDDAVTRRQVEINVLGVIFGTKLALQRMLPRRTGHIINTASLAGELAVPGLATYCATKFAVIGFTEAARLEYRKSGVRLSTVRPTFTNTELVAGTAGAKGLRNAEPEDCPTCDRTTWSHRCTWSAAVPTSRSTYRAGSADKSRFSRPTIPVRDGHGFATTSMREDPVWSGPISLSCPTYG